MKNKYIQSPIIKNPKLYCIYHFLWSGGETKLIFVGNRKVNYIDVSTAVIESATSISWQPSTDLIMFPKEVLPESFDKKALPPLLALSCQHGFISLSAISYSLDDLQVAIDGDKIAVPPLTINDSIKKCYSTKFKNIGVDSGSFPIFYEEKKPSYQFIASVYAQFINYNTSQKLTFQYQESASYCYIRAEFASRYLKTYFNLPTLKIYKHWNPLDWKLLFHDDRAWTFHTATVVIDDASRLWVWDPWVGGNQHLLTVEAWVNRPNEPKPKKILFTSNTIMGDFERGRRPDALLFMGKMDVLNEKCTRAFQAIVGDVIPTNLERPFLSNKDILLALFKRGMFSSNSKTSEAPLQKRMMDYTSS